MNTEPIKCDRVLFVGNLVDVKAPALALAALAVVAKREASPRLDIVGDGPMRKQLKARASALGIAPVTTFHGRQPPAVVADMMRAATCLILTSRSEGMPNVVVEALACGTPVVATPVGEVPFLIKEGVNGCIAETDADTDSEAARGKAIGAALKKALSQSWNRQAIAQTVAGFGWENAARIVAENTAQPGKPGRDRNAPAPLSKRPRTFVFVSTLFPNSIHPTRALYNLRHLSALKKLGHEVKIIAPVPWFPGLSLWGRKYPPKTELFEGFDVSHPRFLAPPRLFVHRHYLFYRRAVARALKRKLRLYRSQLSGNNHMSESRNVNADPGTQTIHILIGFAYPDAVAMAPACKQLLLDYSIFVLGSDFRVRTRQPKFRRAVMRTLRKAPRIFCPGQALRADLMAAGLDEKRIIAFNNGFEKEIFHP